MEAGTMFKRMLLLGPAVLVAAACSIDRAHPTDASVAANTSVAFSAVKFWDAGATVSWNQFATDLAQAAPAPGINTIRLYTYLSLAQFRAAEAAQAAPGAHPPIAAAIGGASVAVLSSFFPGSVTQLEAALDAQEASDPWPGAKHADFAAGEATGRAVGARVLTFAQSDLVGLTNPLDPPIAPPLRRGGRTDLVRHERGRLRRAHRMLRCQVPLLVHPAPAGRRGYPHCVPEAAAPVVPVRSLLFLGCV